MKALLLVFYTLVACSFVSAEKAYEVSSSRGAIKLHVIEIPAEENAGFEIIDGSKAKQKLSVTDFYDAEDDLLIINGGYFDGNLNPVGYCKISGVVVSESHADKLSGYLTIDDAGSLDLHWKTLPQQTFLSVFQAGPFIIDPGGELGIRTDNGLPAKRTVVAKTSSHSILIITTTAVTLYELSHLLKERIPDIDAALNLDGGPSTGLIYKNIRIENQNPVRNFLKKKEFGHPQED